MQIDEQLAQVVVVLYQPQDVVNIAGTMRAMKNMGLRQLRLVQPASFDPYDVEGIAHRSHDLISSAEIFSSIDEALADLTFVVGTSARPRAARQSLMRPRELAPQLLERARQGGVGLLFGREDNGLPNSALDRCHQLVMVPTDPAYPSLNLAQSVLLIAYELRMAAGAEEQPFKAPAREVPPASAAQLEELFVALERALWSVEFFKAHLAENMMRTMRSLVHRAEPDQREAKLMYAMCMETLAFLQRKGLPIAAEQPEGPPHDDLVQ